MSSTQPVCLFAHSTLPIAASKAEQIDAAGCFASLSSMQWGLSPGRAYQAEHILKSGATEVEWAAF